MSDFWLLIASTALAMSGGKSYDVWRLSGTDEAFTTVKQAAAACRYNGVEEAFGEHLVPYLFITIPKRFDADYECLRRWLKENKELGFAVPPASKN